MGSALQPQYPPILPAGVHVKTLPDIDQLCVQAFPGSVTRSAIFADLSDVVVMVSNLGWTLRMWIDGSFLSQKPDPADVDLLIWVPPSVHTRVARLTVGEQQVLQLLTPGALKAAGKKCDSYLSAEYPAGHIQHKTYVDQTMYWRGVFGFDYNNNAKGFVELQVSGSPSPSSGASTAVVMPAGGGPP